MSLPGENNQSIVNYLSDTGEVFQIMQKEKDRAVVQNPAAPTRPNQGPPPRWKLRCITIQCVVKGKRYSRNIVVSDPNNPYFKQDGARQIAVDGFNWTITHRRGESARGAQHE
jgi:hypothetical protein